MHSIARVALGLAAFVALAEPRAVAAPEHEALAGRALAGGKPVADAVIWLDARSAPRPRERTAVFVGILSAPHLVVAQATDVTTEVDITVGRSTKDVRAAGTQLRLFGSLPRDWRFFGELTWADT